MSLRRKEGDIIGSSEHRGHAPAQAPGALPLVSVVIPAFNAAPFVAEAIDSVLAQDYPHVELIVLDDGSTDGTLEVLRRYVGRLTLGGHANVGQSATLNRGWRMSSGTILSYLAADDVLRPDAVSKAVAALRDHAQAAMVYGDYDLLDERSRIVGRVRAPEFDQGHLLFDLVCAPGPGVFLRRQAFEAAGPWDERFHVTPDLEFWMRLALQGPFRRVPAVLAGYRVHAGAVSSRRHSAQECGEPLRVVASFQDAAAHSPAIRAGKRRASSSAHLISARLCLRARHFRPAAMHLRDAVVLWPQCLLRPRTWRLIAGGFVARR